MQDAGRRVPMLTTKCSANRGMGQIPTSSFGLLPNSTPVNSSKKLQRSNSLQNAVTPFPPKPLIQRPKMAPPRGLKACFQTNL